jgi:hypothetical protein
LSPIRMARIESGIRTVLEFNNAFNNHDVERMMQFTSEKCIYETAKPAPDGIKIIGREAISKYWVAFFKNSTNGQREVEEIFGNANQCVLCWKYKWGVGEGNIDYLRGVDIFKLAVNLIEEELSYEKGNNR